MDNYHNEQSVIQAAKRYSAWDKSDPFTFARILCHIHNGVCGRQYHEVDTAFHKKGELIDCFYDAEEHSSYSVGGIVSTVYSNVTRP